MLTSERLREAIYPFAVLGSALAKHGQNDSSPWTEIPDEVVILSGNDINWRITAGQLRAAYMATVENDNSDEEYQ